MTLNIINAMHNALMPKILYPRKILPEIFEWLDNPEIILLTGSRQVGKTYILYLIIKELHNKKVSDNLIHFFNLEELNIFNILNSGPDKFISYLASNGIDLNQRNYIFIDEIQYLDNPSNFLKLLADEYKNLKIFATGSSTLSIKEKFKDSLAGRKQIFEIHPLSFSEFLTFKELSNLSSIINKNSLYKIIYENLIPPINDLSSVTNNIKPLFGEYSLFGGYPKVCLETDYKKKTMQLLEIYNSYIRKDIKDIMHIENVSAFNKLVQLLALQIGGLFNYQTASANIGIARETMQKYIFLLENTFIIKTIPPYFTNKRKEITKMPKIYYHDIGLRNAVLSNFQPQEIRPDTGHVIENVIYGQIVKTLDPLVKINFWRTTSKNEVDFIISKDHVVPVEIKYQVFKEPNIPSGLKSFIDQYNPPLAIVITKDYFAKTIVNKTPVFFIPVWLSEM